MSREKGSFFFWRFQLPVPSSFSQKSRDNSLVLQGKTPIPSLPIRNPTFLRSAVKTSVSPSTQAVDAATTVAAGADKAAGTLRADIAALILGKTTPTRNTRTRAIAKHFLGKGLLHLYLCSQKDRRKASRIMAHAMTVFTKPSITVNPLISGLKATFKTRLNFPWIAMASRKRATTIPSSLFIDAPANHPDFGGSVDQLNWKFHVQSCGNRRRSLEHLLQICQHLHPGNLTVCP